LWENVPVNYNLHLVNRRFLIAGGTALLILLCANGASAGGAYQRTDDRKKTLVWNNDPQPGDAATWTGGRDSEGYAEGAGSLTWLQPEKRSLTGSNISFARKVPISSYTGTMAHGKFEGSVTTVDHGKTYHATYADGQRKGRWNTGPAVAKAENVEPEPAAKERPEPASSAKTSATTERIESQQPKVAEPTTEAPAEGPPTETKPENAEASKTDARLAKTETSSGELSADELDQSATPQKPVSRKAALAPGAVRAIDQPSRQVEKRSEKPKEAPAKIKRATKVEEPKIETGSEQASVPPAEGPLQNVKPPAPTPAPSQASINASAARTNIQPSANETPVDDSIRTLTGPPSSLRAKAPAAPVASPPPPDSAPSIAPASAPASAGPKLNAVQAMDIADIEAREKGFDLGEYQLPKAEYNATDDTWSVSYIGRDGDKGGKHLGVVVQDKSGKAEVKK
jgi:hypothetical protein